MAESEPQTIHKIDLIGAYYVKYPTVLIQAANKFNLDVSHIWIIEVCAGAGGYLSSEHPKGELDGCAVMACRRAREIQRMHPEVTMHVVLVEAATDFCAQLAQAIVPFTDATGVNRVDVRIEPKRFEDVVDEILSRTWNPRSGKYYHSLWFLDPDGFEAIPHETIQKIVDAGRGPEIIINACGSGLARLRKAALTDHRARAAQYVKMNRAFGSDAWRTLAIDDLPWDLEVQRLVAAYADGFAPMKREIYKLRSDGSEIRYFVQLTRSARALDALRAAYETSQHVGLLKGKKLSAAEKDLYARKMHAASPGTTVSVDEVYRSMDGTLNKNQIRWVMQYAASNDYGTFDEQRSEFTWRGELPVNSQTKTPFTAERDDRQPTLFG